MKKEAIYAGGCFWCTEQDLRKVDGVLDVLPGYIGGDETSATYMKVASHQTKHREAVKVEYDDTKTSFKKITQFFLDHIDPTDAGGQFFDRGDNYKTAIYFSNPEEEIIAKSLLTELGESGIYDKPIVVDVLPVLPFYIAESEHQNYAEKNPVRYSAYKQGSGREDFTNMVCAIRGEKKINWKD